MLVEDLKDDVQKNKEPDVHLASFGLVGFGMALPACMWVVRSSTSLAWPACGTLRSPFFDFC